MISNDGNAEIKKAWANITVKVRWLGFRLYGLYNYGKPRPSKWSTDLSQLLLSRNEQYAQLLNNLQCANNSSIIKEPLPWLVNNTVFRRAISIPPGQRVELTLFDFIRISDLLCLTGTNKYLVMIHSELGDKGPYRACLVLTDDHELLLEVTVYGRGARAPLKFKLCITAQKLCHFLLSPPNQSRDVTYRLLNNLKCDTTTPTP